jgi:hypothetical protein
MALIMAEASDAARNDTITAGAPPPGDDTASTTTISEASSLWDGAKSSKTSITDAPSVGRDAGIDADGDTFMPDAPPLGHNADDTTAPHTITTDVSPMGHDADDTTVADTTVATDLWARVTKWVSEVVDTTRPYAPPSRSDPAPGGKRAAAEAIDNRDGKRQRGELPEAKSAAPPSRSDAAPGGKRAGSDTVMTDAESVMGTLDTDKTLAGGHIGWVLKTGPGGKRVAAEAINRDEKRPRGLPEAKSAAPPSRPDAAPGGKRAAVEAIDIGNRKRRPPLPDRSRNEDRGLA